MGQGASSEYNYEEALMKAEKPFWPIVLPDSQREGFSAVYRHYAAKNGLEVGCENTSNGTFFYTLWDAFQRGKEIATAEGNFLGTRTVKVFDGEDQHGDDTSKLPKKYVPSGYVENKNGSVARFEYVWDSYGLVEDLSLAIGRGLVKLGYDTPNINLGIFSTNRAEWIMSSLAFTTQNFRTVALYATLGPDAVEYIIGHSEIPVIFVSKENLHTILKIAPKIKGVVKHVVLFDCIDEKYGNVKDKVSDEDKEKFDAFDINLIGLAEIIKMGQDNPDIPTNFATGDDLSHIMYTSGTTGTPKGVMLSHSNVMSALNTVKHVVDSFPHVYFSYLPLAHIFESVVQCYAWINGGTVGFSSGDIRQLVDDLQALKPTLMPGVPRVFLKFYQNVWAQVEKKSCIARWFINRAYATQCYRLRNNLPLDEFYDSKVFAAMRNLIGFQNIRIGVTGGAPCPPYLVEFMRVLTNGIFVQGYGMTECTAAAGISDPKDTSTVGSIGPPLTDFKLMDVPDMDYLSTNTPPSGEILISGPHIFQGYYKNEQATAETMHVDEDGRKWLMTGDIGRINPNGTFSIIDRKKNLCKLAQGEYVALEKVEDTYGKSPLVCQVWVYGNSYKGQIVSVIVPNAVPIYEHAASKGWWNKDVPKPIPGNLGPDVIAEFKRVVKEHYSEFKALIQESLKSVEGPLLGFEKIKAFDIEVNFDSLGQAFTEELSLLTPTFKLRRPQLRDYYLDNLKAMYISLGEKENAGEKW